MNNNPQEQQPPPLIIRILPKENHPSANMDKEVDRPPPQTNNGSRK